MLQVLVQIKRTHNSHCCKSLIIKSGKGGSNCRPSAWEAEAIPLSYSRVEHKFTFHLTNFGILNKKEEDGCVAH